MNPLDDFLKIAAYQGPIFEGDFNKNTELVMQSMSKAEAEYVDILCMPECFLQGYFDSRQDAEAQSISLDSPAFKQFLDHLKPFQKTTLIVGLNEKSGTEIYNTAVVIEQGRLLGTYRKAYTYPPYEYFSLGSEFPVFEKKGVPYSIIICYDSLFREPALISSLSGARLLFCPMFNRIEKSSPILPYMQDKNHFITRAFDTNCWLVCSDIVWDSDKHICQGHAVILDSNGTIVKVSHPFESQLLIYDIPMSDLRKPKKKRVYGRDDLSHRLFK